MIAQLIAAHGPLAGFRTLVVTTRSEVSLGKTIIGKRRRIDVFVRHEAKPLALGLECKYPASSGTTDEKVPYALADLEAMWIPGCVVYAGEGWSSGVLHTLDGSRNAVFCDPSDTHQRDTTKTRYRHEGRQSWLIPGEGKRGGIELRHEIA